MSDRLRPAVPAGRGQLRGGHIDETTAVLRPAGAGRRRRRHTTMEARLNPGIYAHFTTPLGKFTVRLFDKDAPKTVANFVGLAEGTKEWTDPKTGQKVKTPFYDGLIFHRVIDGFMIQGGDPLGRAPAAPATSSRTSSARSCGTTKAGILSMANAGPEHQRQPVLHHARPDAAPRQQAPRLRRGRRGHGRRAEDRQGQDRRERHSP